MMLAVYLVLGHFAGKIWVNTPYNKACVSGVLRCGQFSGQLYAEKLAPLSYL